MLAQFVYNPVILLRVARLHATSIFSLNQFWLVVPVYVTTNTIEVPNGRIIGTDVEWLAVAIDSGGGEGCGWPSDHWLGEQRTEFLRTSRMADRILSISKVESHLLR